MYKRQLLFSAVIILISGRLFGMDKALYSIIFQFCSTQVINTFYKKYKKKTLLIVTDNPAAISADLLELTNHSSTILKGFGSYTALSLIHIYRNYLVNVDAVFSVNRDTVTLVDYSVLPLSKDRKQRIKELLLSGG